MEKPQQVKVKMCGLTRMEDIKAVNEYCPDFIGFVFAKSSRRYVSPEQAGLLALQARKEICRVGVFVNSPEKQILDLVKKGVIQIIQLHGDEDESYIARLRENLKSCGQAGEKAKIIKAFSVKNQDDIKAAGLSKADYALFDNGPGGTGKMFNWSFLKEIKKPYFLAGGISLDNIKEALNLGEETGCPPFALDISSGAETEGVKDRNKIEKIIRRIRE